MNPTVIASETAKAKVNLFDLHHKYADVMHVDEVVAHLHGQAVKKAG